MKPELKEKILAYNRAVKANTDKAADMDIVTQALLSLPYGQLKKILTEEVLAVLAKYGVFAEEETARSGPY